MTQRNLRWTALETNKISLADPLNINSITTVKRNSSTRAVAQDQVTVQRAEFKSIKPVRTVLTGDAIIASTPSVSINLSCDQYTKNEMKQMLSDLHRNVLVAIDAGMLEGFLAEPGTAFVIDSPLLVV